MLSKVQPGSITLFHNAAANTPAALPGIIESLISEGYEFVLIEDLILKDNYTIDHTGKQIPNSAGVISAPAANSESPDSKASSKSTSN